ncbi:protein LEAD-SENSITIVE 1-like isoform X2 [Solanum dulcamara]|uniref:protein LEAD-SENSITIVE 1-like isoform X2 n=1 Tax=Solanum dulcamara TaxID=45834 RepID=UPI00248652DC|nr:protein LEAD-SENSITIVE 1-like isoform X2 [Solanum dulcamara]
MGIYVGDGMVIHFTRAAGQEIGTGTVLDRFIFSSFPSHPSGSPCPRCGDQSRNEGVISSCLECFLCGGELYLFKYSVSPGLFIAKIRGGTCTIAPSDPPELVLHRAEFLLQNGFGVYNILKNNCEDFAIYCKTSLLAFTNISVGRSGQASSLFAAKTAIASVPLPFLTTCFSGLAVVGSGFYCAHRYAYDIGVRRDVMKIPVEYYLPLVRAAATTTDTSKEKVSMLTAYKWISQVGYYTIANAFEKISR